jgi:hypothetical protein
LNRKDLMVDGPFKHADLHPRWKRFGNDCVDDAPSAKERVDRATANLVADQNLPEFSSLLANLEVHARREQMEFFPLFSFEAIFERYERSPLTDALQRHLSANIRHGEAPHAALSNALLSAAEHLVDTGYSRLDDECIRRRDVGAMNHHDCIKARDRIAKSFDAIDRKELSRLLRAGDKTMLRAMLRKKDGVHDGPD